MKGLTGTRAWSESAGEAHSLVITEEGALHSFGDGGNGKLGHGSVEDERSPKMVDAHRRRSRRWRLLTSAHR